MAINSLNTTHPMATKPYSTPPSSSGVNTSAKNKPQPTENEQKRSTFEKVATPLTMASLTAIGGALGYHSVQVTSIDDLQLGFLGKDKQPLITVKHGENELDTFLLTPDGKEIQGVQKKMVKNNGVKRDPLTDRVVHSTTQQQEVFDQAGYLQSGSLTNEYSSTSGFPHSMLEIDIAKPEMLAKATTAHATIASPYDVTIGLANGLKDPKGNEASPPVHQIEQKANKAQGHSPITFHHANEGDPQWGYFKLNDDILHQKNTTDARFSSLGQWNKTAENTHEFKSHLLSLNAKQRMDELKQALPEGKTLEETIVSMAKQLQSNRTDKMLYGAIGGSVLGAAFVTGVNYWRKHKATRLNQTSNT
jgi:hypothetical protein